MVGFCSHSVTFSRLKITQRWRGSVKARRFVMSLRDHFVEKAAGDSGSVKGTDAWALKYINISRAPSILEAFDDDASGFVTIKEVNDFTKSRPLDWGCAYFPGSQRRFVHHCHRVPHWIAYWAIGNLIHTFEVEWLTVSRLANDLHNVLHEDRRNFRLDGSLVIRSPSRESTDCQCIHPRGMATRWAVRTIHREGRRGNSRAQVPIRVLRRC